MDAETGVRFWEDRYQRLQRDGVVGMMAYGDQHRAQFEEMFETLRHFLQPPDPCKAVLDYGCGRAQWLPIIREVYQPADYLGVDLVGSVIADNEREHHDTLRTNRRVWFKRIDSFRDLGDGKFDMIWCFAVIQHLEGIEALRTIRWFGEHLQPGGVLVMQNHCADQPTSNAYMHSRQAYVYEQWCRYARLSDFTTCKLKNGTEVIQCVR